MQRPIRLQETAGRRPARPRRLHQRHHRTAQRHSARSARARDSWQAAARSVGTGAARSVAIDQRHECATTRRTVLNLAREATALLADAMARIGDSFAIHGFCSNGRHDVGYYRFKDFDRPYGELAKVTLGRHERAALDPDGHGIAPCGRLSEGPARAQETDPAGDRRRTLGHRRARRGNI